MSKSPSASNSLPQGLVGRHDLMIGHRPFIDFANSSYCPEGMVDPTNDWTTFLSFVSLIGLVDKTEKSGLECHKSSETSPVLSESRNLRTALKQMIEQVIDHGNVSPEMIELLNGLIAHNDGGFRLQTGKGKFTLVYRPQKQSPSRTLSLLAQSAADFLCKDRMERLRQCADPGCPLYFYDTSKNGRRRWCRMEVCGNRAKASGHYQRSKQSH